MGEITDALRANLRELAQSDARLLRSLDAAIPDASSPGPAAALIDDGLERLALKDLRALGKQRGIKGITKLKKEELIAELRGGAQPAPASPAALPAAGQSAGRGAATGADLAGLERRLERMEALLLRIAAQLGVS